RKYNQKREESGIQYNFIHGTYLINLGTQNPEHLKKSQEWLIYALNTASKLGVTGVIFHLGSHKGNGFETVLPQIVESLRTILNETKDHQNNNKTPYLILENSAGAGGNIGSKFSELG